MMSKFQSLILVLLSALSPLAAQETPPRQFCEIALPSAEDRAAFFAFDRDLRTALANEDPVGMSLLAGFPLRVNGERGIVLPDAAALQARFSEVFPAAIRKAVLDQDVKTIFCNYVGLMYGNGEVWVTQRGHGYAVTTVNLPHSRNNPKSGAPKLEYVCSAEEHRVIVDSGPDGQPRYRAWNRPRFVDDEPDLEILSGAKTYEGRGPCAHPVWNFKSGEAEFTLMGLGCSPDSSPPPDGSTGLLSVSVPGRQPVTWWCY